MLFHYHCGYLSNCEIVFFCPSMTAFRCAVSCTNFEMKELMSSLRPTMPSLRFLFTVDEIKTFCSEYRCCSV
ncbi:hypothetical protein EVA_17018 [gut metagenome]|uniref:Uncharacterized protein n=1 Tax=gut metagenome TaxID=749906 RepID=J9C4Y1_9ZZZZ